jgi:hypothetical protein
MTFNPVKSHGAPALALVGMLLLGIAAPSAQRRRGGGDADAGVPVATNTIVSNPEGFYGKPVTVSAGVEQVLSKTAFVVDQRKAVGPKQVAAIGKPMLVLAPTLAAPVPGKRYLLMKGQVVKFDAAAIAKAAPGYELDLSPEQAATFQGQPVLMATSVLDSTFVELTVKPAPPAEEKKNTQ